MAKMQGPLSKWTNVMKGWQYRWFVLDDNVGLLSYYTSREKMIRGVRRGCVRMSGAVIGIDDDDECTFTITVDGKTFHFQAHDAEERELWVRSLEDTILRHHSREGRYGVCSPPRTVEEFDKKITEADKYLQIIIEQINDLKWRATYVAECPDQFRIQMVVSETEKLVEHVKHIIIALQIAKNEAYPPVPRYVPPVMTRPDMPDPPRSSPSDVSTQWAAEQERAESSSSDSVPEVVRAESSSSESVLVSSANTPIQTGIEVASECVESKKRRVGFTGGPSGEPSTSGGHSASMTLIVPETSYSSSEEEDEFFDATESQGLQTDPQTIDVERPFLDQIPLDVQSEDPDQPSNLDASASATSFHTAPTCFDGSLDYDAIYEDTDEQDCLMEQQGSIVTHLLSQVKIGMDLTKVVLPTFILERRSLLEMYADYFAHPDIFVKIADFSDPKDRMVQVLRWYMSAYHAGRKSSVAKKPYNPILGEVFQCYWNVPGTEESSPPLPLVADGPVPWCRQDQLTFVSEQVSHHPPISAFYAEHFQKRISFSAHVWTKSKFLGLSVGVHNIGQGCISVLDYDEEYIVTFPNGYGRSILTIPWIELGGSITITCAKSGYNANVEFHTKPFYGGKKHRITAEAFHPNEKKPFLVVNGEWNGRMEAKWSDGTVETFVDVNEIEVVKKIVRPISEQANNESRLLWKEVTAGLRLNDIERATTAKFDLEHKQREEAKERKEKDLKWNTQLFQEAGGNWIYKNSLVRRLAEH